MEVGDYVGKYVKIECSFGFYYKGKVISADENSLTLIDIKGQQVTLSIKSILAVVEVQQ